MKKLICMLSLLIGCTSIEKISQIPVVNIEPEKVVVIENNLIGRPLLFCHLEDHEKVINITEGTLVFVKLPWLLDDIETPIISGPLTLLEQKENFQEPDQDLSLYSFLATRSGTANIYINLFSSLDLETKKNFHLILNIQEKY